MPYEALILRMAAVEHHGGIGTMATGLSADVPSNIEPFLEICNSDGGTWRLLAWSRNRKAADRLQGN